MQGKQPAPKAKPSAYLMSLQKVLPYSQTINVAITTVFGFFLEGQFFSTRTPPSFQNWKTTIA